MDCEACGGLVGLVVWISLRQEVTEVCIRQILNHQSSPGECASLGRCSRGLVSPSDAWVAVPFEQELGAGRTALSDVEKGLRRSLKELPESLATERGSSELGTRSEPGT